MSLLRETEEFHDLRNNVNIRESRLPTQIPSGSVRLYLGELGLCASYLT